MPKSVDQRIVNMKFNNSQFERGVKTTMKSVKKLEESLIIDPESQKKLIDSALIILEELLIKVVIDIRDIREYEPNKKQVIIEKVRKDIQGYKEYQNMISTIRNTPIVTDVNKK